MLRAGVICAGVLRARDVVRTDVCTCSLSERVGDVAARAKGAGQTICIVTSEDNVVLGRLRQAALEGDPEATVESVLDPGPTTIRPDTGLKEFTEHMRARKVGSIIVTTSTGRLIGILYRQDAEEKLGASTTT